MLNGEFAIAERDAAVFEKGQVVARVLAPLAELVESAVDMCRIVIKNDGVVIYVTWDTLDEGEDESSCAVVDIV